MASFAERWAAKEREHGMQSVASRMVPIGGDFLPESAAPCVTFDRAAQPRPIHEIFGAPLEWSDEGRERLSPYLAIGSDGAGNPICVEAGTGHVVLLDHEDEFRTLTFVNSSINQLRESLLAYLGEDDFDRFYAAISEIDPPALYDGSFWWIEATQLGKPD